MSIVSNPKMINVNIRITQMLDLLNKDKIQEVVFVMVFFSLSFALLTICGVGQIFFVGDQKAIRLTKNNFILPPKRNTSNNISHSYLDNLIYNDFRVKQFFFFWFVFYALVLHCISVYLCKTDFPPS